MEKILSPEEISIKYVHGHHDALTDSQEKNDMSKNIQQYAEHHTSETNKEVIQDIEDRAANIKGNLKLLKESNFINSDFIQGATKIAEFEIEFLEKIIKKLK